MASLSVKHQWMVTLETEELRLILKSLGDRLTAEELVEARELGEKLTMLRASTTKQSLQQVDKLLSLLPSKESTDV